MKKNGRSWRCCSAIVVIAASFRLGPTAARTTAAAPLAAHVLERIVDCTAAQGSVRSPGDLVHSIQRMPHGCPRRAAGTMEARERASKRPRRQRPTIVESLRLSSLLLVSVDLAKRWCQLDDFTRKTGSITCMRGAINTNLCFLPVDPIFPFFDMVLKIFCIVNG